MKHNKTGHLGMKKRDIVTLAGTYQVGHNYQPVVALAELKGKFSTLLFNEWFDTRMAALQRAHYLNANQVLDDRITIAYTNGAIGTVKELQDRGFKL